MNPDASPLLVAKGLTKRYDNLNKKLAEKNKDFFSHRVLVYA
jgi:hypothetical protein